MLLDKYATVVLRVEDHANTDYPDIPHRAPIIATSREDSFESAVAKARQMQSRRERGHNLVCLIYVYKEGWTGERPHTFHVSSNGRVWEGREWSAESLEVHVA